MLVCSKKALQSAGLFIASSEAVIE